MPELTVSIINSGNLDLILACLESIYKTADGIGLEVIIVDNASADGSAEAIQGRFPAVKIIRNREKEGFSANHNKAIRAMSSPYVFILNDDTVMHGGALRAMLDFMRKDPAVGAVGGMLLNPDGTPQYTGKARPTVLAAAFISLGLHRLFPGNPVTTKYFGRKEGFQDAEDVESINGAAMMVARAAIEKAGMLDEGFFLFCEDVDWSIRIREAGFRLVFLPGAKITHYRGASTGGRRMVVIYHKSLLRFYRKHYAPARFFLVNWLAYSAILARFILFYCYGAVRKKG